MHANTLLTVATIGLLSGLGVGSILYVVLILSNGGQARVGARVDRFITHRRASASEQAAEREQTGTSKAGERAAVFTDLDRRWQGKSLFKSLQKDIQAANLRVTSTEIVLIQIGIGLGLCVALWAFLQTWGLLLSPLGMLMGTMIVRSLAAGA